MLMQFLQLDNNFSLNYLYYRRIKLIACHHERMDDLLINKVSVVYFLPELSMKADLHPKTSGSTGP